MSIVNDSARIIFNRQIASNGFKLALNIPGKIEIIPGQFAHIRVDQELVNPLLRRPLSIWDSYQSNGDTVIEFIYAVVGKGTEILSKRRRDDNVGFLGPLGNWFTTDEKAKKHIFIAGGVGIVPFYIFAKKLIKKDPQAKIRLLFGARTKDLLYGAQDFENLGIDVQLSTDDGTAGKKGQVTDLLIKNLDKESYYYACGPDPMLEAVTKIAKDNDLCCELSLERRMGCALGACRACVTKIATEDGWRFSRACCEGTVYSAKDLI